MGANMKLFLNTVAIIRLDFGVVSLGSVAPITSPVVNRCAGASPRSSYIVNSGYHRGGIEPNANWLAARTNL